MVSITTVSAAQAGHYYSKDNYYTKANGEWQGRGAELFGLCGDVRKEEFQNLLEGKDKDGRQLIEGSNANNGEHRAGVDLTFSAPKSVSILSEVVADERIRDAHDLAVTKALEYVEDNFSQARQTQEGATKAVGTGNLVVAKFQHNTSRELDPQLHTHCVVLNMTRREDGQWRALSNEEIFSNKMLIGQIYRNELAANLKEIGYAIESDSKGFFEVQGIDRKLLEHFSQRSEQIEAKVNELRENGLYQNSSNQKLREIATLGSRASKQDVNMEIVRDSWQERLQNQGYTKETILESTIQAVEKAKLAEEMRKAPPHNEYDYVRLAYMAHTEQESVFSREGILKTAGKFSIGEKRIEELGKAFGELVKDKEIVVLDKEKGLYTTKEMLKIEKGIVEKVKAGRNQVLPALNKEQAEKVITDKYSYLTQGQKDAASHILTSSDRIIGIQGDAGTGKTTMLEVVREQLEAQGLHVRGLAFTGKAASEIEKNGGIESSTLHSFLSNSSSLSGTSAGKEVWVVDEASMVGSRQMSTLLRAAEKDDSRVVLIGDVKQLQAVEAGKMFNKLQESGTLSTVRMYEVQRQKEEGYRDVVKDISAKRIDSALNKLETQGRIQEIDDRKERLDAIVNDYTGKGNARDTIIVTARNQDRKELNSTIRDKLRLEGGLPREGYIFTVRESINLTPAERHFAQSYKEGDLVIANKAGIMGRAGSEGRVVGADPQNHTITVMKSNKDEYCINLKANGLHLASYTEIQQSFSQGDKVVFLKNDKGLNVQNAITGEITNIDEKGNTTIKLDNERDLKFNIKSQYNYLDHGYAVTDYKSQGHTAKEVIYHADTQREVNYNQAYVAITRGKEDVRVYTDSKADLKEQMEEEQVKTSTLDYEKSDSSKSEHIQSDEKSQNSSGKEVER